MPGPDGLVRIALKKPFSDGTIAVDLDPLSLLCRVAAYFRRRQREVTRKSVQNEGEKPKRAAGK